MRTLFTLLFFGFAIVAACIKEDRLGDTYVSLTYKQTQCSDPWPTGNTDSLTLINVIHYLDSAHLYIAGINLTSGNPNSGYECAACPCKTGKLINVTTLNNDSLLARYKRVGFE